jgi:hypothetical protein
VAKFDDQDIGGKEYESIYWQFDGDREKAIRLTGLGRKLLGDMKNRMRLGELPYYAQRVHLEDGTVFAMSSNLHGLSPIDRVHIYVPPVAGGGKDILLGFIVRITSATKQFLILNVKEPVEKDQEDGVGIQTEYWHDTALTNEEDGYANYEEYAEVFPQYPDNLLYGFEWSFESFSNLTDPTHEKDKGFKTDERGPIDSNSKTGLSWIYPGEYNRTDAYVADANYAWYGQLWSTNGSGLPVAPMEAPQWGGYQSIIDAVFSIPALDNGSPTNYNVQLARDISAYGTGSTSRVKGLTITSSLQKTTDPITRYFNSNYELSEGTIIVKAINDDEDFHAFAVVKPGIQKYQVPKQYKDMLKTEVTVTEYWEYSNPFNATRPIINISGQTAHASLPPNTVLAMGDSFGESATIDTSLVPPTQYLYPVPIKSSLTRTLTNRYTFNDWEMYSQVKGGEYEIDIKTWWGFDINSIQDLDFEVDITLIGSKYPAFKYSDSIRRVPDNNFDYLSNKICKIKLLQEADFISGGFNPYISVVPRDT